MFFCFPASLLSYHTYILSAQIARTLGYPVPFNFPGSLNPLFSPLSAPSPSPGFPSNPLPIKLHGHLQAGNPFPYPELRLPSGGFVFP